MNIKVAKNSNTYVRIAIEGGLEINSSVVENSTNPSWLSKESPSGEISDIGLFCKEKP